MHDFRLHGTQTTATCVLFFLPLVYPVISLGLFWPLGWNRTQLCTQKTNFQISNANYHKLSIPI